jgi:hypothetical protein
MFQGFEPRGTEISKRVRTYQSIVENKKKTMDLYPYSPSDMHPVPSGTSTSVVIDNNEGHNSTSAADTDEDDEEEDEDEDLNDPSALNSHNQPWTTRAKNYFCGLPSKY